MVPIQRLLLDEENPRHGPVPSQPDAVAALIADQGTKLVRLAEDIIKHGTSPIDRLIVIREGGNYVVLEGNRRLLVLKLLNNPQLAGGGKLEKAFAKLSKKGNFPTELDCSVFSNRAAARHWIELRHTGEAGGAGVVNWAAAQSSRFHHKPGSQSARALEFITSARSAFKGDNAVIDNLDAIAKERLTTLGRLVADSDFRKNYGIKEQKDGKLLWEYPPDELKPYLQRIISDLATTLSVTDIKTKVHREKYYKQVGTPNPANRQARPHRLDAKGGAAGTSGQPRPIKPGPIFGTFVPKNKKLSALVGEIRKLDVEKFPNACGVLTRVILEIAVDDAYTRKSWAIGPSDKLKDKVKLCLLEVDPSGRDKAFQGVRVGLTDPNSMLSITTMHAFVHSSGFRPVAADVRTIADNYEPFLVAVDKI